MRSVFAGTVLAAVIGLVSCGESAARRAEREAAEAKRVADDAAAAKARYEATQANEVERLKALWIYSDTPAGRGRQISAQIRSTKDVDTDGSGPRSVLLVFRDHPAWGRSSYLVLTAGDFRCSPKCTVVVTADDQAPKTMAAHKPKTDEAIAMFIDDWRTLWRATSGVTTLSIEFPAKNGGTRTALFDVAGLDRAKMPTWK